MEKTHPKRTLVTGGAGFIGSHLVERLLADGHYVMVLDNLSTGNLENLAQVKDNDRLNVHCVDVVDSKAIDSYFEGIDWVFHLAGCTEVMTSWQQPLYYHRVNVDGTVAVLEAARKAGVRRFVYSASASCYGNPVQIPTPETAPIQILHPYALTKYIGEQYALQWGNMFGLSSTSLRLFNVYGPRARFTGAYASVISIFLKQKQFQQPLTIVGDGSQTRDFVYVTDVANAFVKAAECVMSGEVFNIGSGKSHTIKYVSECFGGDTISLPRRQGEPPCSQADIYKSKQCLAWLPQVSLEFGIDLLKHHLTTRH